MGQLVVAGALCRCSFGTLPCPLVVVPTHRVMGGGPPAATIMDHKPIANLATFGLCQTTTNPVVAAATSLAAGVLTPMPCIPVTPSPWAPGSPTVLLGGLPALNNSSKLMCNWAGVIGVDFPGQVTIGVP